MPFMKIFQRKFWHFTPSPASTTYMQNFFNKIVKNSNSGKFRPMKYKRYTVYWSLSWCFRSAAHERLSVDALVSELKASMLFKEGSVAVIREVWKTEGQVLCSLPKQALSVGEVRERERERERRGYLVSPAPVHGLEAWCVHELLHLSISLVSSRYPPVEGLRVRRAGTYSHSWDDPPSIPGEEKEPPTGSWDPSFPSTLLPPPPLQNFATQLKEMATALENAA